MLAFKCRPAAPPGIRASPEVSIVESSFLQKLMGLGWWFWKCFIVAMKSGGILSHLKPTWWWGSGVTLSRPLYSVVNRITPPVECLGHADKCYHLVNLQKAIENCHRNSEFSHEKWWFSIVFCMFTRGYQLGWPDPSADPSADIGWPDQVPPLLGMNFQILQPFNPPVFQSKI